MDSLTSAASRPINFDALKDFSPLKPATRTHLKNVYACVGVAMAAASAGVWLASNVHFFGSLGLFGLLGSLGCICALAATRGTFSVGRYGMLAGLGFFTGTSSAPLVAAVAAVNPAIIGTAFMATTLMFTCFSLAAIFAQARSMLFLGGILSSALSMLMMASFISLFMGPSVALLQFHLYFGVLVFSGFVMFDTQLIIHRFEQGDGDFIWHSVDLFIDFVAIMKRLMVILAQKERKKGNNNTSSSKRR